MFCCTVQFVMPSAVPHQSGVPAAKQLPENRVSTNFFISAFLPSFVIYLCIVAPVVLVSSGTVWEGMVRHCHCPSSKGTMVKEANPWELQGGAYKACLAPLQRWGQWGFSRPLFSTHCRTLAHTLCIPSCNLSLPVILSSSEILPMLISC